jgi:hypothetical protein
MGLLHKYYQVSQDKLSCFTLIAQLYMFEKGEQVVAHARNVQLPLVLRRTEEYN